MEEEYFVTVSKAERPSSCRFFSKGTQQCIHGENLIKPMCLIAYCPEIQRKPYARLSVNKLTLKEKEAVEKRLTGGDKEFRLFHYDLHTVDDAERGDEHYLLIGAFIQGRKRGEKCIRAMLHYAEAAEDIRSLLRPSTSEPSPQEPPIMVPAMATLSPASPILMAATDKGNIPSVKNSEPNKNKSESALPKPPKQTRNKYEAPVGEYIDDLVEHVLNGNLPSARVANLSARDIAERLKKMPAFEKAGIKSIEDKVRRTDAWKKRKNKLKEVYDTGTLRNRRTSNTPYQEVQ